MAQNQELKDYIDEQVPITAPDGSKMIKSLNANNAITATAYVMGVQTPPVGGAAGDYLRKKSATDFDMEWVAFPTLNFIPVSEKGAAGGVATLDGNAKVPTSQLPAIVIGETFTVSSQAQMLALPANIGDVAIRTDQGNNKYMLLGEPASVLSNWSPMGVTGPVTSVNGQTGIVVLGKADVGLGNVDNTSDLSKPISNAQASVNSSDAGRLTALEQADGSADVRMDAIEAVNTAQDSAITALQQKDVAHDNRMDNIDTAITGLANDMIAVENKNTSQDADIQLLADEIIAQAQKDVSQDADINSRIPKAEKGVADGVATLGADGKVPAAQLPPIPPSGVTSFNTRTGAVVSQVGDYDKTMVGLANVDNTSDANKPVSTAQAAADNLRILLTEKGAADGVATLDATGKVPASQLPAATGGVTSFNTRTGAVVPVAGDYDKTMVGLANVDNTSDANKPVSTAQAAADNLRILLTEKAAANGVATLDATGKVPASQLPAVSGNFIENQNAAAQTANFWISGMGTFNNGITLTRPAWQEPAITIIDPINGLVSSRFYVDGRVRIRENLKIGVDPTSGVGGGGPMLEAYGNSVGVVPSSTNGFAFGWNRNDGSASSNLIWCAAGGSDNALQIDHYDGVAVTAKAQFLPNGNFKLLNGVVQLAPATSDYPVVNGGLFYRSDTQVFRAGMNGAYKTLASVEEAVLTGAVITVDKAHPLATDTRTGISKYSLGVPFRTIQGAVNVATWGDTINVAYNTYTENVDIVGTIGSISVVFDGAILNGYFRSNNVAGSVRLILNKGAQINGLVGQLVNQSGEWVLTGDKTGKIITTNQPVFANIFKAFNLDTLDVGTSTVSQYGGGLWIDNVRNLIGRTGGVPILSNIGSWTQAGMTSAAGTVKLRNIDRIVDLKFPVGVETYLYADNVNFEDTTAPDWTSVYKAQIRNCTFFAPSGYAGFNNNPSYYYSFDNCQFEFSSAVTNALTINPQSGTFVFVTGCKANSTALINAHANTTELSNLASVNFKAFKLTIP